MFSWLRKKFGPADEKPVQMPVEFDPATPGVPIAMNRKQRRYADKLQRQRNAVIRASKRKIKARQLAVIRASKRKAKRGYE